MASRMTWLVNAIVLSGCADMSGLGGTNKFACKAPEGVRCESLSGTYYNSLANNLPAQRHNGTTSGQRKITPQSKTDSQHPTLEPSHASISAGALRVPGREMRIWIKAWQDDDNDLTDQSYVYLMVTGGHWRIGHVQQRERSSFARLRPPPSMPAPKLAEDAPSPPLPNPSPLQPAITTGSADPEK